MTIPDIRRIILLVALGVVGYLLVQAWVSDAEDRNRRASPDRSAPLSVPSLSANGEENRVTDNTTSLDVPQPAPQNTGDIPDASTLQSIPTQGTTMQGSTPRELIEVVTPTLHVWIDPLGGDIVGARLPGYPISLDEPEVPISLLNRSVGRTYTAQSGLMGDDGFDQSGSRPTYRSFRPLWELTDGTLEVPLTYEREGITVTKTFTFHSDRYDIQVRFDVVNRSNEDFVANMFAQLKRDSEKPADATTGFFRPPAYLGAAVSTNKTKYKKLKFQKIRENAFAEPVTGGWIAILQHYFLSAWIPPQDANYIYFGNQGTDGLFRFGFTGPPQSIAPNSSGRFETTFYAGPKRQKPLDALAPNLGLTVDYGFFWWLSIPIFKVLEWIQSWIVNWGLAIILLTIFIKTLLFPLSAMSYRSMAKMRKLTPKIKRIQERYGSDRQKMGQEMMALYGKEKANPLSGCLPLLVQMPVFFALYWVLIESVELRQAPFMLWIQDLGAMDPWFVFPILNGLSMFLMQKLNPPMADPMQQRMMMMMPIFFAGICIFMPAGLVLYWFTNNLYSMTHHYFALKKAGAT